KLPNRPQPKLRLTYQAYPNSSRIHRSDSRATTAWLPQFHSEPDILARCSTANPSNARHTCVAPDYDARSSTMPNNADPNALRDRRLDKILSFRGCFLRRSKYEKCDRGTPPIRAEAL